MSCRRLACALALAVTVLSPAFAQTPDYQPTSTTPEPGLPRTPEGRPDLQGVVWATNYFPVFGAGLSPKLELPEDEAKALVAATVKGFLNSGDPNSSIDPEVHMIIGEVDGLPLVRGARRTRQIVLPVDGKLPYTAEAVAEARATDPLMGKGYGDPEARPSAERCLSHAPPPLSSTLTYTRMRFVQTADHVVIQFEQGDEVRIIPFAAGARVPGGQWMGRSLARWEGDTLVIETTGLREEDRVRTVPKFIVGADAKVVERITRVSADELLYQYTVEDTKVYAQPWLAEFSLHRSATGMFPGSCHKENYSLPNILKGARVMEGWR